MQLVYIALIGVGVAAVVGLFGPLAIKTGRVLQNIIGSENNDHQDHHHAHHVAAAIGYRTRQK